MEQYDAAIVGAGAAGLSAAAYAAALDTRVLLLDCSDGASSDFAKSGGGPAAAGTRFQEQAGVADSPELWLEDIRRKTSNAFEESIAHLVVNRARDAIHFQATRLNIDIHLVRNIPVAGHSVSRLYGTPRESGREYFESLASAVARLPQVVRRNDAEAIGLLVDNGVVRGVRARIGGQDQSIETPFTVLACGGFAANRRMLDDFIPDIAGALHIGCPHNNGCGLQWAQALGAATSFMDSYQGHGHVTADGQGRLGLGLTTLGAIMVDLNGRRFVREDIGPSELASHVLATTQGTAIEVYDERIHNLASSMGAYRDVVERGAARRFETASELASSFGIPLDAFVTTLETADKAVRGVVADPLDRKAYAQALIPPLWGVRVVGALAHTQGGLRVNANAEVISAAGRRIPGLLAAGGTVTGISGHGAAGYSSGNGLAQAFALGTIAAETISRRRVRD
jgi:fumarate reductase flavoprotein subunit